MLTPKLSGWENRQTFASFFQGQVNTIQQGTIAGQAGLSFIFLILDHAKSALQQPTNLAWPIFLTVLISWFLLGLSLFRGFEMEACRTLASYEAEWDVLFPGEPPLRLAGFLLDRTYARRRSKHKT